MRSIILSTATRYILPLLILFSFFALLRGHNEPGGGFVGGLIAAAAFALYIIAHDVAAARRLLRLAPRHFIGSGLVVAVSSGLVGPIFYGDPFMTGHWSTGEIPVIGKVGTPLMFDVGVYLVVMGITLAIIFTLGEEEEAN